MKQFLIIVFRNQFNLFYRFGFTTINIAETIEFEGEITDIIKNKIVSRFAKMTPFQYDEEYLIMHFEKDQLDSEFLQLNINDVISISEVNRISLLMLPNLL